MLLPPLLDCLARIPFPLPLNHGATFVVLTFAPAQAQFHFCVVVFQIHPQWSQGQSFLGSLQRQVIYLGTV